MKATIGGHASVDTLTSRVVVSLHIKSVSRDFSVAVNAILKEFLEYFLVLEALLGILQDILTIAILDCIGPQEPPSTDLVFS